MPVLAGSSLLAADLVDILVVVGPSKHPPGSHEADAGGRLMAHCLEQIPDVRVHVFYEWPSDAAIREKADSVVFIGDTFPASRFPEPETVMKELSLMMDRGCGIVCVHYATGLMGHDVEEDGEHPLLHWLGGYFANKTCPHHQSIAKIYPDATITPAAPDHPISRGWKEFTLHDEPYINNYFGKDENRLAPNVTALATSMLPPGAPKREVVAWCVEREDSGRGFGIVMPHFYKNWTLEELRRFILNGIVWSVGQEVPEGGVSTTLPDLATFAPESVEFVPRKPKS